MAASDPALPELFHAIADSGSATARRLLVELDLGDVVRIRNVTYPEVQADLRAHGGTTTPAWWDGATLVEGQEQVVAAMRALAAKRAE